MSHFAIWLSLFQLLLHLFAIAHFYSSKTQSTGLSQTWAPIPVFRSVICCIQRLEGNHSQLQSLSRCCSLRDERPVRGKLTRRGANNHNKPQITWKDFDHLVCFDWNGRHRRAWACTFFFFCSDGIWISATPAAQCAYHACACVPALRGKGTRCNGETAFQ